MFELCSKMLSGSYRVLFLLLFAGSCYLVHILKYPFPKRDALTYLHILHDWNRTGSFADVLSAFPKFGLLLFSFLPLKWAEKCSISLYPASIVLMFLMSLVSVYAFYKIVLLLTKDVQKAMMCGALLSVHPMILLYAGNLLRDTPYLMFCLLHFLCLIYAIRDRRWYYFLLTGITLAMCLLSRFEAWEMLVLFPFFGMFYAWKNKMVKRDVLLFILFAALGFFGTVVFMLSAIDDLSLLYEKGNFIFLSFLPSWLRGI